MPSFFGLIIGALGRFILPGKQNIPIWLTGGIAAALLGILSPTRWASATPVASTGSK